MPKTHPHTRAKRAASRIQVILLGALSVFSSFVLGIQSAGEVQTVSQSAATGMVIAGDMNQDQLVNALDAIIILECAQGHAVPTSEQLMADPNGDGFLTTDDALDVLRDIASRS